MSRLIDADALIEFIENRYDITWKYDYEGGIKDACTDILEKISEMPTIEPERKRGKWELSSIMHSTPPTYMMRCSECGMKTFGVHDFCPNCGADMREPEDIPMEYFESGGRRKNDQQRERDRVDNRR